MTAIDGAIVLNLLIAGVLTFAVGGVALVLMQRAMVRNMMRTSGKPPPIDEAAQPRRPADEPLAIVTDELAKPAGHEPTAAILRRLAIAHASAGLAFAVVTALVLLPMSGMEFLPLRTAVVVWAYGWPTVLVLNFLSGPDRRLQLCVIGIYFGVLLALCAVATLRGTPPLELEGVSVPGFFQPLIIWALNALPSLFLLLFLNRTIRTIGPTVIVFVLVLLFGSHAAVMLIATEPFMTPAIRAALAMGLGGTGLFWSAIVAGGLVAIWPAWRCATFLRDRYVSKRTSELMVTVGAIWLLQALMLSFNLARAHGALGVAAALLPLIAWRATLALGLRPVRRAAAAKPPERLLMLRVFGFGRRTRRLMDLLGARWRLIGSIDLIAAPDLASRTVEPASFMAFLRGRLASLFILNGEQLRARFAALDHEPDPDGRYRINPLFCGNDMWKDAVVRLMGEASLVVMDLRGFGPQRRGCVYELQTLLDVVPLERLVLLVDTTTQQDALKAVLEERWQALSTASPNLQREKPLLRLVDATGRDARAMRQILSLVALRAAAQA